MTNYSISEKVKFRKNNSIGVSQGTECTVVAFKEYSRKQKEYFVTYSPDNNNSILV